MPTRAIRPYTQRRLCANGGVHLYAVRNGGKLMLMAFCSVKLSESPFRSSIISMSLRSCTSLSRIRYPFRLLFISSASSSSSSLRIYERNPDWGTGADSCFPSRPRNPHWYDDASSSTVVSTSELVNSSDENSENTRKPPLGVSTSTTPSAFWLQKWSPPDPQPPPDLRDPATGGDGDSISRIIHRLRRLAFNLKDHEEDIASEEDEQRVQLDGSERLGDLLVRTWNRPGTPYVEQHILPWEREGYQQLAERDDGDHKKKRVRAPWLAELTMEDSELRRLRRLGMILRERVSVPKAGLTQAVLDKIHETWRKSELVRLKFHEVLARDMKTAHHLVERRTGGLVIWRSGSVMVVYQGSNYKNPSTHQDPKSVPDSNKVMAEDNEHFVPDVSTAYKSPAEKNTHNLSSPCHVNPLQISHKHAEDMSEEEAEYNQLLDELGPRFRDWWGTGILPVDADLLPLTIPGYKTPFRLLPTGMRLRLTNSELTALRKMSKGLPCHFALGRNRHHQGLAVAILKLWEKSLVAKIAVKRGVQNANNKLMATELKSLTGGILLMRNKYYIVIYRGKDFLPPTVANALAERQQLTNDIQIAEDMSRSCIASEYCYESTLDGHALAGTLAEFREAQARWGRSITADEREAMKRAASRSEAARMVKKIEHKLYIAQAKKWKAEKLLAKIEASMIPVNPLDDQETITDEERSVFRRIGLRMKAYLPLGIRGVFDGVIENMHLHWKHRELVKLISKQKVLSFVEDTARLLEYESGGILVTIERVPKGFLLVYYRGKNYRRPICLRPKNLLTKAKALKRFVAMQRHEALSKHIIDLEKSIKHMKSDLGHEDIDENSSINSEYGDHASELSETEDQGYEDDCDSGISECNDVSSAIDIEHLNSSRDLAFSEMVEDDKDDYISDCTDFSDTGPVISYEQVK